MSGYKLVLFDFDGTIFDTWPLILFSLLETKKYYSPDHIVNSIAKLHANIPRKDMLYEVLGYIPTNVEEEYFVSVYFNIVKQTKPYDLVQETLDDIIKSGIAWGIVTNKPKRYVDLLSLEYNFLEKSTINVYGDSLITPKPSPDGLIFAMKSLGVSPQECLYVGDGVNDLKACLSAKIDFARATYGYEKFGEDEQNNCKFEINTFSEILKILKLE